MKAMQDFTAWGPRILAALDESPSKGAAVVRQALATFAHYDLPLGWRQDGAWILVIPKKLDSPNQTIWGHWRKLSAAKKAWEQWIWATVARVEGCASRFALQELQRAPACRVRMTLTVLRFVPSVRNFIKDDDNLAFSIKHANDALKAVQLVRDDNRDWLQVSLPIQDVSPIAGCPVTVFILRPEIPALFAGVTPHADRREYPPASTKGPIDHGRAQEGRAVPGVRRRARARAVDV